MCIRSRHVYNPGLRCFSVSSDLIKHLQKSQFFSAQSLLTLNYFAKSKWYNPNPSSSLAVAHRTGDLQVGDLAVVAAVGAEHRDVAFAACHALIDELKATVPIWKHQFFTGGDSEWVDSA